MANHVAFKRHRDEPYILEVTEVLRRQIGIRLGIHLPALTVKRREASRDHATTKQQEYGEDASAMGLEAIIRCAARGELMNAPAYARVVGNGAGYGAVGRLARERKRQRKNVPLSEVPSPAVQEASSASGALVAALKNAGLDPVELEMVWSHIIRDERYATIGERCGLSAKQCARICQRAVGKARDAYRRMQGE